MNINRNKNPKKRIKERIKGKESERTRRTIRRGNTEG